MNVLDLLYIPLALATAPWWAGKRRAGWRERFGHVEASAPAAGRRRVLLHAVSVGEVAALRHLVPLLAPDVDVVVSTTTDTGLTRATQLYGAMPGVRVVRYPLDFSWAVDRFLDAVRPDAVGLVELEVWPNFVRACRRRGVPVCIVNGRLSERSARGYSRLRGFFGRVLGQLECVAVQDESYASRFIALGLAPERCEISGSMKWDAASIEDRVEGADALAAELGIDPNKPLVVAGSTGPGEEALLHRACPPGVQLLCAPRKPERFDEATAAMGAGAVRRTALKAAGRPAAKGTERFVLDTIGELRRAYSLATVVVVGRSFGSQYGSDPIEPVALGKPVVIGPAVADFAAIVAALRDGGGLVQVEGERLGATLAGLLADAGAREALSTRGREVIRAMQGASARHAAILMRLAGVRDTPQHS
jgi:3-deoxy-D-manno-octulosonic-acid transferase